MLEIDNLSAFSGNSAHKQQNENQDAELIELSDHLLGGIQRRRRRNTSRRSSQRTRGIDG